MEVSVQISGHRRTPGLEKTFTENVSASGARVRTVRRWEPNERLTIATHSGDFRATARVAYCEPMKSEGFAIGLEFLEPTGRWVIGAPATRENR